MDGAHDRGRFDQLLALGDDDAALGDARQGMPGAAHPLQRGRDVARRLQLHHEIDRAHVDAEFERRGRHQRLELAVLQTVLGVQPRAA
ncbi:MAG TPA: hypothetical protein VFF43_18175 [Caldimonas sp.]|nr:hypothetical protein [Caldimonas sp.]